MNKTLIRILVWMALGVVILTGADHILGVKFEESVNITAVILHNLLCTAYGAVMFKIVNEA